MKGKGRGYRRLFRLGIRRRREYDEEIESHLAMRTDELVRRGLSPDEARAEAIRRFGDRGVAVGSAERRDRALRRAAGVEALVRDVELAIRRARREPGPTLLAVLTLALGIGLTTAVFTVVDRVALRDLPFPEADRLVALQSVDSIGTSIEVVSSANWLDWKTQAATLEATAIHWGRRITISTPDDAFRVSGQLVSGSFLETIRPPMRAGRAFTDAEVAAGAEVVVVSEGFWRRVLGGNPDLPVSISADGVPVEVVGVVSEGVAYPAGTEIWRPIRFRPQAGAVRNNINWLAVGRMRSGGTLATARDELSRIALGIREVDPVALYSYAVEVIPLKRLVVGDVTAYLALLMGSVGFVLLIACANLAALNFARNAFRTRDVATRVALGASRRRIVQQLAVEHLVVALVGGALGVGLAYIVTGMAVRGIGGLIPRVGEVGIDGRVLAFGLIVSVGAGLLTGLAPALDASSAAPGRAMSGARGGVGGGRNLPGAFLVGGEVALAVLLLTGGGLLVQSFRTLLSRDLGFQPNGVVTAAVALTDAKYRGEPQRWVSYWDGLLRDLRTAEGVAAVGAANWIPTATAGATFVALEDQPDPPAGARYRVVTEDYFDALGVPRLAGRGFGPDDGPSTPRVALVNRVLAETFWPDQDPVGRRLRATSMESSMGAPWITVVGVVGDLRHSGFESDPHPEMYVYYQQVPFLTSAMTAVVRGEAIPPAQLAAVVRQRIRAVDPSLAVDLDFLDDRVQALVATQRTVMLVLTGFAALALFLAGIGVYGLMAFAVAQRTREIAVRSALGAPRNRILRMVIGNAMRIATLGTVAGLLAAFWLTRLMSAFLVDVAPNDPTIFGTAAVTLMVAASIAAAVPAWRAARLHPVEVLRAE